MKNSPPLVLLSLCLLLSLAHAESAPPASSDRAEPSGLAVEGRRPLPPVERVLSDLQISEQQREHIRSLLHSWRQEAEQEQAARQQAHRRALAQILNADQVVAVLAALPPPAGHAPPPARSAARQ